MIDGEPPPFEVLSRNRVHDGFVKLDVYQIRQRTFEGGVSPILRREVVVAHAAVAALCYDPDRDIVVLVEQIRLPAALAGLPAIQTEIVAGLIEPGEPPEAVARREVREETGLDVIGAPLTIAAIATTPGHSTETVHIFCVRVDASRVDRFSGLADEHEDIRVVAMPYDEFRNRVRTGGIGNGFTLIAGLWLLANRDMTREIWSERP